MYNNEIREQVLNKFTSLNSKIETFQQLFTKKVEEIEQLNSKIERRSKGKFHKIRNKDDNSLEWRRLGFLKYELLQVVMNLNYLKEQKARWENSIILKVYEWIPNGNE